VEMKQERTVVYLILNAYWRPLNFELPHLYSGGPWRRWIDTGLQSPLDIVPWHTAAPNSGATYRAQARSVVVLLAGLKETSA